jgi:SAM-dependent methyltransferase
MSPAAGRRLRREHLQYVDWDVATWARALDFWDDRLAGRIRGARVLELGARDGALSQWFCVNGAEHVVCSDFGGPTSLARTRHRDLLATGQIEHQDLDATDLQFDGEFDIVACKSVLGGIAGKRGVEALGAVASGVAKSLRPGGKLLFAENLKSSALHRWARERFVPWSDEWRYLTDVELLDILSEFDAVDWTTTGFTAAFGRRERATRVLARVDELLVDRITPPSSRYVMCGVASV